MLKTLSTLFRIAIVFAVGIFVGLYRLPPATDYDALARRLGGTPTPIPLLPLPLYTQKLAMFRASPARADVVMLGDSLTDGIEWREYLDGISVIGRGIPGDLTDGVLGRLDEVLARAPRVVSVLAGTNDMQAGFEPDHSVANLRTIATNLQHGGVKVIMTTIPYSAANYHPTINPSVDRLNPKIRALAAELGTGLIDLNTLTSKSTEIDPSLTYDGLHFSPAAYGIWLRELRPMLDAALAK